jgi:uncharacterized RDD family membrane protein YckC
MFYHVAKNGAQLGPWSESEITGRLASGELSANDLCWTEGMADWQPLGTRFQSPVATPAPSAATINPYAAPASNVLRASSTPLGEHPGFWRRVVAHIIDSIVMNIASAMGGFVVGISMASLGIRDEFALQMTGGGVGILVSWLYYASMESSASQGTLGKMALGIMVTDLNGERISFGRASGRYFGQIVSALTLGIGFLMCAWTEKKQCLHDMMAGCLLHKKN